MRSLPQAAFVVAVATTAATAISGASAFVVSSPQSSSRSPASAYSRWMPLRETAVATLDGKDIDNEFTPINNYMLVQGAETKEQSDGGIILTGKQKITKSEGKVVSVGPGRIYEDSGVYIPMPVKAGESVVYGKYSGTELDYNGKKHLLVSDIDVMVKFEGDELTLEGADVIYDNVMVYVEEKEEDASVGGILLAKSSTKSRSTKPSTGEVIKVGPGRTAINGELMEMDVAVGDFVKFRDFSGEKVEIEGKKYSVVKMNDILAKF
mmetsp:Transcript_2391/g.6930  ORF Transcript_2391/g.6930 Transcript_2391/m.6930 type:complete len:265 (+) Transcript_2391:123-917(+)|eukprot:CAMPEP_0181047512 /NCGR_PEP_ID=MMETSP1070-20121207/14923_1 /TAXON_ID=265543 /ORGANISM="Minutocellus polymorphus, Strain NH13" /LENGTH=264 /DNA_ID=CAMNT_0023126197 /DNA_START=61 /DNA_END=855 /DNA_ORIENTATION=-